jgi:hypothetical protein
MDTGCGGAACRCVVEKIEQPSISGVLAPWIDSVGMSIAAPYRVVYALALEG